MLVYRITPKIFSKALSAPGFPGRWNGAGKKVVYAAESIPLAFMENMIRRKVIGFNSDFAIMIIDVPDKLNVTEIHSSMLSPGWRDFSDYAICQARGNDWYDEGVSPILKVPSAVLPTNYNFVINAEHKDFKMIRIVGVSDLIVDDRVEELIRGK